MTKVDLQKGWYGCNVFYRMQVIHEANQDNYLLFTRWGRIGDTGQFQTSPCESLEKARTEFCKIVQSKTGNDWYASKQVSNSSADGPPPLAASLIRTWPP